MAVSWTILQRALAFPRPFAPLLRLLPVSPISLSLASALANLLVPSTNRVSVLGICTTLEVQTPLRGHADAHTFYDGTIAAVLIFQAQPSDIPNRGNVTLNVIQAATEAHFANTGMARARTKAVLALSYTRKVENWLLYKSDQWRGPLRESSVHSLEPSSTSRPLAAQFPEHDKIARVSRQIRGDEKAIIVVVHTADLRQV